MLHFCLAEFASIADTTTKVHNDQTIPFYVIPPVVCTHSDVSHIEECQLSACLLTPGKIVETFYNYEKHNGYTSYLIPPY